MAEQYEDTFESLLSEVARAEIEGQAETAAGEEPELAAALFAPLGDEMSSAIARRIRDQRESETGRDPARGTALAADDGSSRTQRPSERGTSGPESPGTRSESGFWPPRWWSGSDSGLRWAVAAALVAVVAAALLRGIFSNPSHQPLPGFTLDVSGIAVERSADPSEPRFRDGERFVFRLKPDRAVIGEANFALFIAAADGTVLRWREAERAAERSADGAWTAGKHAWPFGAGDFTLVFVVARQPVESWREDWSETSEGIAATDGEATVIVRHPLTVEPAEEVP